MATENPSKPNVDTESVVSDRAMRQAAKSMRAVNRVAKQLETQIKKLRAEWMKYDKTVSRSVASQNKSIAAQKQMVVSLRQTTRSLKNQNRELRQSTRESQAATRATNGLFGSLSRVAGILGVGALGAASIKRVQTNIDRTFSAALMGGVGSLRGIRSAAGGRNVSEAFDLSAKFRGQSNFARFGIGDTKGLIAAQKALQSLGFERANEIILDVTKTLEPKQLQQFLSTAASGNIKRALMQSASGANIGEVSTALNALEISQGKTDSPELEAAKTYAMAANSIADSFDKLSAKIMTELLPAMDSAIQRFAALSPGAQAALLGAGAAGGLLANFAGGFAGGALGRGAGKGVLRGIGAGARGLGRGVGVIGRGLGSLPYGAAWAHGLAGLEAAAPAALAVGAPAVAAGSLYTLGRSFQTAKDERRALNAIQGSQEDRRLFDLASGNKGSATTERQRLVAQRQAIEAQLLSAPVDPGTKGGFFSPDLPEADSKQIEKLRAMRAEVQAQIKAIDDAGGGKGGDSKGGIFTDLFTSIRAGAKRVGEVGKVFGDKVQEFIDKGLEANVRRLQQQAAKAEQLQLTAGEKGSLTALRRAEYDLATINPYGVAASRPQMESLLASINEEIAALQGVLESIDQSTAGGRVEANRTRVEITQLRVEEKSLNKQWIEAMQGLAVSDALNASGPFRKIILAQDNALAMALRKGIIRNDLPEVTGSVGQSKGLQPRSFADVWNNSPNAAGAVVKALTGTSNRESVADQAKEIARHDEHRARMSQRLAELLAQTPEPVAPEMLRPTRAGGRTALGTQ